MDTTKLDTIMGIVAILIVVGGMLMLFNGVKGMK